MEMHPRSTYQSNNQSKLLTIPNALSILRAAGIPVFIWAYFHFSSHIWAFLILAAASATDYLDGKLARALHQESNLGKILDPAIDRLYIFAVLILFWFENLLPIWVIGLLILRDLILGIVSIQLIRRKLSLIEVNFLGKAATFNLLYGFPILIVSSNVGPGKIAHLFSTAFIGWGVPLYLITGIEYFSSARRRLKNEE